MKRLFQPALFFIALISFAFAATASRAQETQQAKAPKLQVLRKMMTVEDYKEALPQTAEELYMDGFLKLKEQGDVVVLDVRSKESFARRHLMGSVNAPLTDLTEKTLPALAPDKNTPVVLACDYSFQPVRMLAMTIQAYPVLRANGYANIYRLNLWHDKGGGEMRGDEEQEKLLDFEGSDVTARQQEKE